MARINGTLIILDVDGDPLTHVSTATLNTSRDLPEANDKDSGSWADHLDEAGLKEWGIDVDGNADWQEDKNVQDLFKLFDDRKAVTIVFGPESSDHVNFTGDASTNELSFDAPDEETATLSGTMTGKGELELIITS